MRALTSLFFASLLISSVVQAQATTFPACSINPIGYIVQPVHCTDGRANCGNPQPIPYGEPGVAGTFFVVPKGQIVTLKTKSDEHQHQVQCVLQQDVFPSLTYNANKKLVAYRLHNGQEVYTKEGEPWEESSFVRLGIPVRIIYNDTFK